MKAETLHSVNEFFVPLAALVGFMAGFFLCLWLANNTTVINAAHHATQECVAVTANNQTQNFCKPPVEEKQ
jgi:hypothetical protein